MRPLRTLIVDDEPLARRRLEMLLARNDEIRIVGTASGCREARQAIATHRPDVVLLDVRMRDGTGFDVLAGLPSENSPAVIFVTAFDRYAVKAFEAAAIDYVLKPIDFSRLHVALERARDKIANEDARTRLEEAIAGLEPAASNTATLRDRYQDEIWVPSGSGGLVRIELRDVEYVSAEVDYVRYHVGAQSYLARDTLVRLQEKLDPCQFIRIHRSSIVNISAIREVRRPAVGALEVHLSSGVRLRVGRAFSAGLRELVQGT